RITRAGRTGEHILQTGIGGEKVGEGDGCHGALLRCSVVLATLLRVGRRCLALMRLCCGLGSSIHRHSARLDHCGPCLDFAFEQVLQLFGRPALARDPAGAGLAQRNDGCGELGATVAPQINRKSCGPGGGALTSIDTTAMLLSASPSFATYSKLSV